MSPSASLVCVHPTDVARVWPLVAPLVVGAITRTNLCHTLDVVPDVLSGKAQLWLALAGDKILAAATTILRRTDRELICELTALGGRDRKRWLSMLAPIEAWAKTEGAARVRFYGRPGWVRILENYSAKHVILERAL